MPASLNHSILTSKDSSRFASLGVDDSAQPYGRDEDDLMDFFVHIHVPKTGGTTFNSLLGEMFGKSFESFAGRFIHLYPALTTAQVANFISKHPGIEAVASHKFRAVLPYQTAEKRIIAISFLRDPIYMFFSYYFHMRNRYGVNCPEKDYELDDYISFTRETYPNRIPGYLQRYVESESDLAFEYVKSLSDNGHLYLFPTDKMEESLVYLSERFPPKFKPVRIKKENISLKDQTVTDRHKEIVAELVSPFDIKLMELSRV